MVLYIPAATRLCVRPLENHRLYNESVTAGNRKVIRQTPDVSDLLVVATSKKSYRSLFCRAILCKRGLRCLCVCHVRGFCQIE